MACSRVPRNTHQPSPHECLAKSARSLIRRIKARSSHTVKGAASQSTGCPITCPEHCLRSPLVHQRRSRDRTLRDLHALHAVRKLAMHRPGPCYSQSPPGRLATVSSHQVGLPNLSQGRPCEMSKGKIPTSSTSALPHRLDTERFPCFATFAPAAAAMMVAPVLMLTEPMPSPPVPTMSKTSPAVGTCMQRACMAFARPATSSAVSPCRPTMSLRQGKAGPAGVIVSKATLLRPDILRQQPMSTLRIQWMKMSSRCLMAVLSSPQSRETHAGSVQGLALALRSTRKAAICVSAAPSTRACRM